jgi:hypothetical protein
MSDQRRAGVIQLNVNSEMQDCAGEFSYSLGGAMREGLVGPDRVQGFKETPSIPYIEGPIRDRRTLDVAAMQAMTDGTITLELANGKVIVLRNAWYAGELVGNTDEGTIQARWEGLSAEEVA